MCCWSFNLRVKAGCETWQIALHIAPKLTILGWKFQNFSGEGASAFPHLIFLQINHWPNHSSFSVLNGMAIFRREPPNRGVECRWGTQKNDILNEHKSNKKLSCRIETARCFVFVCSQLQHTYSAVFLLPVIAASDLLVHKILSWLGYPMVKKFRRYLYSFWRNSRTWQTHRQTDGQTPHDSIDRAYASHRAAKTM